MAQEREQFNKQGDKLEKQIVECQVGVLPSAACCCLSMALPLNLYMSMALSLSLPLSMPLTSAAHLPSMSMALALALSASTAQPQAAGTSRMLACVHPAGAPGPRGAEQPKAHPGPAHCRANDQPGKEVVGHGN